MTEKVPLQASAAPPEGASVSAPRNGFHWRDGWFFERLPDGSVWVRRHYKQGASDLYDISLTIPPAEWGSIVAAVSCQTDQSDAYRTAIGFHGASYEGMEKSQ